MALIEMDFINGGGTPEYNSEQITATFSNRQINVKNGVILLTSVQREYTIFNVYFVVDGTVVHSYSLNSDSYTYSNGVLTFSCSNFQGLNPLILRTFIVN